MTHRASRRNFLTTTALASTPYLFPGRSKAKSIVRVPTGPTPEEAGISSRHISDFVDALAEGGHELHGLIIQRRGKILAAGVADLYGGPFYGPQGDTVNRAVYSLSKSFTSTAIGIAIEEGHFQLEDKVVSFFPKETPSDPDKNLTNMEIRHLLTMSAGMARNATSSTFAETNWVKAFLHQPVVHPPGSQFDYNTAATYMLSAILQKVTSEKLVDYLQPRIFKKLAIEGVTWDECPQGISKGGFGLNITTEGIARFGQLYLQNGKWAGEQLVPKTWIEEATSHQIQQEENDNQNPDWQQGYGYQFWRCRHGAYRGDGAFGQFCIVLPEKEVVIAMNSESPSMQAELDLVWKHLLPNFKDAPLPADEEAAKALSDQLQQLRVPIPTTPTALEENWKRGETTLKFDSPNPLHLETLRLNFLENLATISAVRNDTKTWGITCGNGHWETGRIPVAHSKSWLVSRGATDEEGASATGAAGAWIAEDTFEMVWRYYETPHHDVIRIRFEDGSATMDLFDSMSLRRGREKPKLSLEATLS